jgi:hypothetical protein
MAEISLYDLRRTCARLCHIAGCELEHQFLLGLVSVQTTEQYLGLQATVPVGCPDLYRARRKAPACTAKARDVRPAAFRLG